MPFRIGIALASALRGWRLAAVLAAGLAPRMAECAPVPDPWKNPIYLESVPWKYRAGDSAQWASPGYSDAHWESAALHESGSRVLVPRDSVGWYRARIELGPAPDPSRTLAFALTPLTPQEIWWDGVAVCRTGRVSARAGEERIEYRQSCVIPKPLTGPGTHLLSIRLSAHHGVCFPAPIDMRLGESDRVYLGYLGTVASMFFLSGVFTFGALYRFLNYRALGYGRNSVLFSVFVASCAIYIVAQFLPVFLPSSPGAVLAVRLTIGIAWYFMISLVPDYIVFSDSFPYAWVQKALLIVGFIVAFPMLFGYSGILPFHWFNLVYGMNKVFTFTSIGTSVWVIAWAVWKRQPGSLPALLGILSLLMGVIASWAWYVDWAWAAGVAAHVLCLARAQSHQLSERMRSLKDADLRSARLELELLKKNIQPHFLLNSLNSIIAWLEEEPRTAVRLVNALADELGMLLRISAEKLIPLRDEVELCRTHLQVMGLRQDKSYTLAERGLEGTGKIPPMVLHTLVENGLTHGYAGKRSGAFTLTREAVPGGERLSLFNDGTPSPRREPRGEGTGLRYVRSRLEEAYPGRWSLDSRAVAGGWEVSIEIRAGKD